MGRKVMAWQREEWWIVRVKRPLICRFLLFIQLHGSYDMAHTICHVSWLDGICGHDSEGSGEGKGGKDEGDNEGDGAFSRAAVDIMVHHFLSYHLCLCIHHHHDPEGKCGVCVCVYVCTSIFIITMVLKLCCVCMWTCVFIRIYQVV